MGQIIIYIFRACVSILWELGGRTEEGYMIANVMIFCIVWPLFTIRLIWLVLKQKRMINVLRSESQLLSDKIF